MTGIQNTEIIQYADDFTILVSGKNHKENNCDEIMSKFYNELNKLKLKLNTQKCRTILFNWKRKKLMEKISVKINGQNIERTNTQRILGFYIDNKLNFNKHIREMQDSCKKRIIIVKAFSGPNRGSHPEQMLRILNACVISKIIYGTKIINISKSNMEALQRVQNCGLRQCLGLINQFRL